MKVDEILSEEAGTTSQFMKDLKHEFNAKAKELGVTIVATMGWPALLKDGIWYGGGIRLRGRAEKYDPDAILNRADLPGPAFDRLQEQEAYPFLEYLAERLEQFLAAGHTVKLAKGANRSAAIDAVPGKVLQQLKENLEITYPPGVTSYTRTMGNIAKNREIMFPCIAWFISFPEQLTGRATLMVGVYSPFPSEGRLFLYGNVDRKVGTKLVKLKKLVDQDGRHNDSVYKDTYKNIARFVYELLGKPSSKSGVGEYGLYLKLGIPGKNEIPLSQEQMDKLVAFLQKEFEQ